MPLLVTAHEDEFIRIFDITTGLCLLIIYVYPESSFLIDAIAGQCMHTMLAHLDGVTSLSIDATGFSLISGSHDCPVLFWDLLGSRPCVREITTHREKAREGILDAKSHPSLPFMVSAGADGVEKLYASS
jgi:striatin 1/3/4